MIVFQLTSFSNSKWSWRLCIIQTLFTDVAIRKPSYI